MLGRLGFTGRLMAIVLLALLVVIAVGSGLAYMARKRGAVDANAMLLPERAAAIVEVLENTPPARRQTTLDALSSEVLSVTYSDGPPPADAREQHLPAVERLIAQYFAEVGGRHVIAMLAPEAGPRWRQLRLGQYWLSSREPLKGCHRAQHGWICRTGEPWRCLAAHLGHAAGVRYRRAGSARRAGGDHRHHARGAAAARACGLGVALCRQRHAAAGGSARCARDPPADRLHQRYAGAHCRARQRPNNPPRRHLSRSQDLPDASALARGDRRRPRAAGAHRARSRRRHGADRGCVGARTGSGGFGPP